MNSKFVIEPKYDNEVGFIELDNTRKLVRHFEAIISERIDMTIDVYQDGLIKIYKKIKLFHIGGSFINNHPENIIELLLSLELTNGEEINEDYLDLLESIYSPFCERDYNPYNKNNDGNVTRLRPIIFWVQQGTVFSDEYRKFEEKRFELFTKTFKTLHIMKKMYENSFIC
jgi:hypothetical protein